jgi:hypothetical protein
MRSTKLISLIGFLGLMSCGNDIDLITYADPIPVVYGIICPKDSIHEITLKRSFICENNIPLYSSNPDSNYYPNAQVFLETRVQSGEIIQRTEMFKYELPPRETDLFVSSPNYVYRCLKKDMIDPNPDVKELRYALTINIPDQNKSIIAESLIPPVPEIVEPKEGSSPFQLNLLISKPYRFLWKGSLDYYIEFETRVNFLEEINGEWKKNSISHYRQYNHWDKEVLKPGEVLITGDWFYPMIGGKIQADPRVTSRKFISIDFIIKSSDASFYDYFSYEHFQTDLSTNTYTNIINGLGIFVAYNKIEWKGYTLNPASLSQLAVGKYTKHLNFSRWQ